MGSKGASYGSATVEQVASNIFASEFDYGDNALVGSTSFVSQYLNPNLIPNPYYVEGLGIFKYAANIRKFYIDPSVPYYGTRVFLSETLVGEFSSLAALNNAMNAICGYNWVEATNINNDYYTRQSYAQGNNVAAFEWGLKLRVEKINVWKTNTELSNTFTSASKPDYENLINGYYLDSRTLPSNIKIVAPQTKTVLIEYYRQNLSEGVPSLKSIDWMYYKVDLIKGRECYLPIFSPVLGTLWIDDPVIESLIKGIPALPGQYSYADCFPSAVSGLFSYWNGLYEAANSIATAVSPGSLISDFITTQVSSSVKILGASNNYWNNAQAVNNLGFDINHPMFAVDNLRAYNWHIKPQSDGSYGDLVMNSPLLENIGKALDVAKWSVNADDPNLPRVDNLGWRINRICDVAGIRVKTDGTIDTDRDKKLVRQVVNKDKTIDAKKIGIISFGELGMVVKRISNRFKRKGKSAEIVSDQCVIVQDIPQLMQEYFDQINLALGIQESSAIEIKQGDKGEDIARFNNQLEILIELVNLMSSSNEMTRSTLVSSLVTQSQTNELIAGLGLPSVTKTIPIQIGKKVTQLPFKGIAAHRSISQEVATATYNIGIVLGQVL